MNWVANRGETGATNDKKVGAIRKHEAVMRGSPTQACRVSLLARAQPARALLTALRNRQASSAILSGTPLSGPLAPATLCRHRS